MDFIKKIVNEIFDKLKKFQHSFTSNYGYGRFFRILFTSCIHFVYGLLLLIVGRMTFKIFKSTAIPVNSIQSTLLSDEREPENSQKIGHVEHLEEREDKLVTSAYAEESTMRWLLDQGRRASMLFQRSVSRRRRRRRRRRG